MSKIEWTEKTWNPIVGCSIVSPGCTNCYAMKMAARIEAINGAAFLKARSGQDTISTKTPTHYHGTTQPSKAGPVWTGKVALAPAHILTEPLRRKKPTTYFVNSMGDLFHEDVSDAWIDQVFAVMSLAPQHTFQVLTKRSARMLAYFKVEHNRSGSRNRIYDACRDLTKSNSVGTGQWPLPNVWLGVSAERQTEADARIPDLLATPAAVRFVSAEPLLGPIDFTFVGDAKGHDGEFRYNALTGDALQWGGLIAGTGIWQTNADKVRPCAKLDWIIVGGESGRDARPMHPDWARAIRDQCKGRDDALHMLGLPDTAFFFKQWGEWAPGECAAYPQTRTELTATWFSGRWMFSAITRVAGSEQHSDDEPTLYRFGKARAGRLFDGREWSEMPSAQPEQVPA